jgi:hypothetical protein
MKIIAIIAFGLLSVVAVGCGSTKVQPPEAAAVCAFVNPQMDKVEKDFNQMLVRIDKLSDEDQKKVARGLVEKALADATTLRHEVCSAENEDAAVAAKDKYIVILEADSKAVFKYNDYLRSQASSPEEIHRLLKKADDLVHGESVDKDNVMEPSPALQSARNVEARRLRQSNFRVTYIQNTYDTLWIDVSGTRTESDYNHFICKSKLNQRLWSKLRFNFTSDNANTMDIPLPVSCQ